MPLQQERHCWRQTEGAEKCTVCNNIHVFRNRLIGSLAFELLLTPPRDFDFINLT